MRITRLLSAWLAAAVLAAALPSGCANESAGRSMLQVLDVNQNTALQSDVVTLVSGSPVVFEDEVKITIKNVPHDPGVSLKPDGPYGYVVVERYDVQFESPEDVEGFSGSLGWTVPTGQSVTGTIVIVPGGLKLENPLAALAVGGEIVSIAHVTLHGREATSNEPITASFMLQVDFANFQDK